MLIMLGMLMLIGCFVFYKSITGFAVYLFKDIGRDSLNYSYPGFINIAETLWRGELPGWSFEQGLGQNVFPFSLSDPTTYPLYLLGSENLAFGIIWVELFKIIGSGLLFFSFLKKRAVDTRAAYMGGLLYAFSGFMIIGSGWYIFSTLGLYVALILLSFEMLYLERKWWLFPIGIALLAAFNVVNLYTCSVFLFLYVLLRVFGDEAGNFKQLTKLLISMVLLGALGILISSVLSVPNLMQMVASPRVSGEASYTNNLSAPPMFELGDGNYLVTWLMRTFSSDLLGNGTLENINSYKGWRNYLEAPLGYCGLITLLLVPQLFTLLKARQRIVYGMFLGIFIFATIFPWFRRGFWLFQGDYFRDFSLYTAIIFILFSTLTFDKFIKGGAVNRLVLGISFCVSVSLLYFPYGIILQDDFGGYTPLSEAIDQETQLKILLFLILLVAGLILFVSKKFISYAAFCILMITFAELATFNHHTVDMRHVITNQELHQKTGYNDYSIDAITLIKRQDRDFFRIEKNYGSTVHRSLNDAKVQHYYGSSSYSSFNQLNYINFLGVTEVLDPKNEDETRWVKGVKDSMALQVLTGVRYFLFKGDWESSPDNIYSKIGSVGDVNILKSRYALPMGIAYDTYITQTNFSRLTGENRQIALMKAIMIPDAIAPSLPSMSEISGEHVSNSDYSLDELSLDTEKLKSNRLFITDFSDNHINGRIKTKLKQLVFFSFPFDPNWSATVNGKDIEMLMVDGGLSAVLVEPGDNVIFLQYDTPYVKAGLCITMLGLLIYGILLLRNRNATKLKTKM